MNSTEASQSGFRKAPERFNSINMRFTTDKLILSMIDSKMLFVAEVNQPIIASPAITVDDAFRVHSSSDYCL